MDDEADLLAAAMIHGGHSVFRNTSLRLMWFRAQLQEEISVEAFWSVFPKDIKT